MIFILCILLLQACKGDKEEVGENNIEPEQEETPSPDVIPTTPLVKIPSITLTSSEFHSVIGWLSNDEILFTLMDKGVWTVQSYSISTNSWRTIYTTSTPIIEGTIHPNKKMILLHTSSNSSTAEVQIIHINGQLVQNLSFESAELYIDWHPTNPDLIVFTTFYEDWTYSAFVYDGTTQNLQSIEVENPFVKWYDEEHLMVFRWSESSLDGSELMLYSINDKKLKETGISHLIDVQTSPDSILYVKVNEEAKQYEYRLEHRDTKDSFEWTSPAVSNYSEWVLPIVSMNPSNGLVAIKSSESGNHDEFDTNGIISSITFEGQTELGEIKGRPIDCSPNGKVCLGGYEKENWIELYPLKEQTWIHFKE